MAKNDPADMTVEEWAAYRAIRWAEIDRYHRLANWGIAVAVAATAVAVFAYIMAAVS